MSPKAQQILREQVEQFFFGEGAALAAGLRAAQGEVMRTRRSPPFDVRARAPTAAPGLAAGVSWRAAGFEPRAIDLAVEPLDEAGGARRARFVAIAVPMHTALRLGAESARASGAQSARAPLLLRALRAAEPRVSARAAAADSVARRRVRGGARRARASSRRRRRRPRLRSLDRLKLRWRPRARALPPLERYARLVDGRRRRLAGYVEASRGCLHLCRHCPIPPVYGGRFFVVPVESCWPTCAQQVAAGARHVTLRRSRLPQRPHARARGGPRDPRRASRRSPSTSRSRSSTSCSIASCSPSSARSAAPSSSARWSRCSERVLAHPRQGPHARGRRRRARASCATPACRCARRWCRSRRGRRSPTTSS